MKSKLLLLCIVVFFFICSIALAQVTMQVGNNTLSTGTSTLSPFMTNEKGDNIIHFSREKEQEHRSQEIAPVIQVYPQIDIDHHGRPRDPFTHHGTHRKK